MTEKSFTWSSLGQTDSLLRMRMNMEKRLNMYNSGVTKCKCTVTKLLVKKGFLRRLKTNSFDYFLGKKANHTLFHFFAIQEWEY